MGFGDDHHLRSHRGQNVLAPLRRWVQRRVRRPESAVRAARDPTASIQAVPDALAVAESLLGSAPLVCGAYWSAVTVRPLAALLDAAGPNGDGGGIGWVNLAVENVDTGTTTPGWDRAAEIGLRRRSGRRLAGACGARRRRDVVAAAVFHLLHHA